MAGITFVCFLSEQPRKRIGIKIRSIRSILKELTEASRQSSCKNYKKLRTNFRINLKNIKLHKVLYINILKLTISGYSYTILRMQCISKTIDQTNAVAEAVDAGFCNLNFTGDAEKEIQKYIKSYYERLSPRQIMNVDEASDYMRISTRKMRDLQLRGEVKHTLVDSRIIFRREDLDRYAEKNSVFN